MDPITRAAIARVLTQPQASRRLPFSTTETRARFSPAVSDEVYWMCGACCARCNVRLAPRTGLPNSFQIDHVVPLSRGGTDHLSNLQPLCQRCNGSKSNRHAQDYRPAEVRAKYPAPIPRRPLAQRRREAHLQRPTDADGGSALWLPPEPATRRVARPASVMQTRNSPPPQPIDEPTFGERRWLWGLIFVVMLVAAMIVAVKLRATKPEEAEEVLPSCTTLSAGDPVPLDPCYDKVTGDVLPQSVRRNGCLFLVWPGPGLWAREGGMIHEGSLPERYSECG